MPLASGAVGSATAAGRSLIEAVGRHTAIVYSFREPGKFEATWVLAAVLCGVALAATAFFTGVFQTAIGHFNEGTLGGIQAHQVGFRVQAFQIGADGAR
mgnify:CR=1 FL=1